MAFSSRFLVPLGMLALLAGCGRQPAVSADGLPLRRVVIYRNGVAYFERAGQTSTRIDEVSKRIVEIDAKLAELRIQFKELLRDLVVIAPLPPR